MIKEKQLKLIKQLINQKKTLSLKFNYNGLEILLSFNQYLDESNNYLIRIYSKLKDIEYISLFKYSSTLFSKYLFETKNKKYEIMFYRMLKILIDENEKLSDFWDKLNEKILSWNKHLANESVDKYINKWFYLDKTKERGVYLSHFSNKKMSKKHFEYLSSKFNISVKQLIYIQKRGFTIYTTNKYPEASRYMKLLEKVPNELNGLLDIK